MRFPAGHLTELLNAQPYLGEGAYGPTHGPVVTGLHAQYESRRELRTTAGGDEVVVTTTVRLSPDRDRGVDLEKALAPESLVTVRGRDYRVTSSGPVLYRGRVVYVEAVLS